MLVSVEYRKVSILKLLVSVDTRQSLVSVDIRELVSVDIRQSLVSVDIRELVSVCGAVSFHFLVFL